jgi:hypothetical protein
MPDLRPMRNGSVDVESPAGVPGALAGSINDVNEIPNSALVIARAIVSSAGVVRAAVNCDAEKTDTGVYHVTLTGDALNAPVASVGVKVAIQGAFDALLPVKGSIIVFEPENAGDPFIVKTYDDGVSEDMPFSILFDAIKTV